MMYLEVVGTDKVGFVTKPKHGSRSFDRLESKYNFINKMQIDWSPAKSKGYTVLYPYRDNFECAKSGFIEDFKVVGSVLGDEKSYSDQGQKKFNMVVRKDLKKLLGFILNKHNNFHPFFVGGSGHKHICLNHPFIKFFWNEMFLNDNWDGGKVYFFDLKHLSNPRLIEWISEIDDRWKDVSISHENAESDDLVKLEMLKILKELKNELGEDYLDFQDIENWQVFRVSDLMEQQLLSVVKKLKYFLDINQL